MSQNIIADVQIGSGAGQYYGTIEVTNIRYEDGSAVTAQNFLGVQFVSPHTTADTQVNTLLTPWQQTSAEVTTEPIDGSSDKVTAKIILESAHTFVGSDKITFGINGDVTVQSDTWVGSFAFFADALPSGGVTVTVQAAPDAALSGLQQKVNLEVSGRVTTLVLAPGESKTFDVQAGNYTVSAGELATADETVVSSASASPSTISVAVGQSVDIAVSYGSVSTYSALDISIGQLPSAINAEQIAVSVTDKATGKPLADSFVSNANNTTSLRRLPASGTAVVTAGITLNNVMYSATKNVSLSNSLIQVSVGASDVVTQDMDTTGFVDLPVTVSATADSRINTSQVVPVRLQSTSSALVYAEDIDVSGSGSGTTTTFGVPVAPGEYTVKVSGFLQGSVVYAVQGPPTITVPTTLALVARRGADLNVRGFPPYLSFGALTDLFDMEGTDLTRARVSAIFKYAGNDGAGDPGTYLADDPATTKTVQLAAKIEAKLGGGQSVLPMLISYTCNLSLGAVESQLADGTQHAHSFANLILSLRLARQASTRAASEPAAGYIVNADFLGECQKHAFPPSYSMPVREPLTDALAHHGLADQLAPPPDAITDTLAGYVAAVNWLFRAVDPAVTFGWQINLWGVGSSSWIYSRAGDANSDPAANAKKTTDYVASLGVYGGQWTPDFLAVDRYEADDFTQRAYANSYCYSPYEWSRFYDFCAAASLALQTPVAPWQIPASRIPNARTDAVTNLEVEHWGTGGTYLFGDAAVGSSLDNIHKTVLDIPLPPALILHDSVRSLFAAAQPWDLSAPKYVDFPLRGIFSVLLGGGATTGVITTVGTTGPWTQDKVSGYMTAPIGF